MRVAVLASGSGTILDAMLTDGLAVEVVIVDRPCAATDVAARHGVDSVHVERDTFGPGFDRIAYTRRLTAELVDRRVELVVMAGFGTILETPLYEHYAGRVLNTHPSLLPSFPGWHAVDEALAYGVKVTGCTVHVAVAEVDAGPILAQHAVPIVADDTVESLHERIKEVERRLYLDTVRAIVDRGWVLPDDPAGPTHDRSAPGDRADSNARRP